MRCQNRHSLLEDLGSIIVTLFVKKNKIENLSH